MLINVYRIPHAYQFLVYSLIDFLRKNDNSRKIITNSHISLHITTPDILKTIFVTISQPGSVVKRKVP